MIKSNSINGKGGIIGINLDGSAQVNSLSQASSDNNPFGIPFNLSPTSVYNQVFTGGNADTDLILPNGTTLELYRQFELTNRSAYIITVKNNTAVIVGYLLPFATMIVQLTNNLSPAGTWTINSTPQNIPRMDMQLRISDSPTNPLGTNSATGSLTLYILPYQGNSVTIWNNSLNIYTQHNFTAFNIPVPTTAGNIYDVYVQGITPSTLSCSTVAWTGNTPPARTARDGRIMDSTGARTLVGVIDVTNNRIFSYDGERSILNYFNQVQLGINCQLPAAVTSYTVTSTAMGSMNGNTTIGQGRFAFVSDTFANAINFNAYTCASSNSAECYACGIAVNSTTTATKYATIGYSTGSATEGTTISCSVTTRGITGSNFVQCVESVLSGTAEVMPNSAAGGRGIGQGLNGVWVG